MKNFSLERASQNKNEITANYLLNKMGSAIILDYEQLSFIVKRDLLSEFKEKEAIFNPYTPEGYLIYRVFSEEQEYNRKIHEINDFVESQKQKQQTQQKTKTNK